MKQPRFLILLALAALAPAVSSAASVSRVSEPPALQHLEAHAPGRSVRVAEGYRHQWPGVYFEARFEGAEVFFKVGAGDVILRVLVDGERIDTLVKPKPGTYRIADLAPRAHGVRIESVSESQSAANLFGGFFHATATRPLPVKPRTRQIEFIGDSHTVGYGNTSTTRECSSEDVWKTTDNAQAFGPAIARHYDADYQVNAISGRGIVRNYNGGPGDTLPVAYPFALLDHSTRFENSAWHPQVIVIALGTNDFSTPLNAGEKWKSREALHADYVASYVTFLKSLRARDPKAFLVVWATDQPGGEIETSAGKVVAELRAKGDQRVEFAPVRGLAMTGCHWHPSIADDEIVAGALIRAIDAGMADWR